MSAFNVSLFDSRPAIAIIRHLTLSQVKVFMPHFVATGFTTIEVTMNTNEKAEIIAFLLESYPELNIGAGSVCSIDDAQWAIEHGCHFLVTPIMIPEVINFAKSKNTVIIPGAFTPTEIFTAQELGAFAVKVFPAKTLGPDYIKQLKAPMNHLRLVPTGGVDASNIKLFFDARAYGVGIGSALLNSSLLNASQENLLTHFKSIAACFEN